ncbi:MAG TPA: hypothetical protein VGO96_01470 [Pyrinomonadaceae bacterium]|jgi:hypothetical protein|nr:hypothetical protein [Pyrinomonadaceae bacterium]
MSKEWGFEPVLSEKSRCHELGFYFRPRVRVTGSLSDADGRPVPSQLNVYLKLIVPTKGTS